MCGICGFVGKKEEQKNILSDMMRAIRHRGPDAQGIFQEKNVAFGFCRLSIIDLEKGNQPIFNEDRSKCLVFNGEIYNYRELRTELEKKGHVFSTDADSEVLIHSYEEYGEKMPKYLRGMFAFSIWDSVKQKLFAARDFFGIKPFYYSITDDCFVFASEIKSILRFPGYEKKINEKALEQYWLFSIQHWKKLFLKGFSGWSQDIFWYMKIKN